MGNLLKLVAITVPAVFIVLFLYIMESKKIDVQMQKEDIEFQADWDSFLQENFPRQYKKRQKILKEKQKELEQARKEYNFFDQKEKELYEQFEQAAKDFNNDTELQEKLFKKEKKLLDRR